MKTLLLLLSLVFTLNSYSQVIHFPYLKHSYSSVRSQLLRDGKKIKEEKFNDQMYPYSISYDDKEFESTFYLGFGPDKTCVYASIFSHNTARINFWINALNDKCVKVSSTQWMHYFMKDIYRVELIYDDNIEGPIITWFIVK